MKFLKALALALVAALTLSTAYAQYQNVPPNVVGPLNAYSFPCNPTSSVGYPGVGAAGCQIGVSVGTTFTLGAGTGGCATPSAPSGTATAGTLVCTGTAGAATVVVNLPQLPSTYHGYACSVNDLTSGAGAGGTKTALSLNSALLSFTTTTTGDTVVFNCTGF